MSGHKMEFLIIDTDYPKFLHELYRIVEKKT